LPGTTDFPILNRNHSPFSQTRATPASFHSLSNNTNNPQSAPILTAQQQANLQNFSSSLSVSNSSLSSNALQQQLQQQQLLNSNSNSMGSFGLSSNFTNNPMNSNNGMNSVLMQSVANNQGKMWSSFGAYKDSSASEFSV
jgi:hypothetical protein